MPRLRIRRTLLLVAGLMFAWPGGRIPAPDFEGPAMADALRAADQGDWAAAASAASHTRNRVAAEIIDWIRLRQGAGSWPEYVDFLAGNPDWPGLDLMRKVAERRIPADLGSAEVIAFFQGRTPETGSGVLLLAAALKQTGQSAEAERRLIDAWIRMSLTVDERQLFLAEHASLVENHHAARLDNLLWQGETRAAEAMYPLVDEGEIALAKARLALRRDQGGVDALVAAVPEERLNTPGLAYERMQWRARKERWESAEELVLAHSILPETLGQAERWGRRRRGLARLAMREGRYLPAYRMASRHQLSEGSDFADLEWLAGYIALRFLDEPARAVGHFERFRNSVRTPISLGRAGYWLGLAEEAAGNTDAAQAAYALGAENQTSFYGQMAVEHAGLPVDQALVATPDVGDWRAAEFINSEPMQAALLFQKAGDITQMQRFMMHVGETRTAVEGAQLAQMAMEFGQPTVALRVGKVMAEFGTIVPEAYYPITDLAQQSGDILPELAMAIARQESELNPDAGSPVGARGLMQLMPGTAREVAEGLGLEYVPERLGDPVYNARLGTTYLAGLMRQFDGSVLLSAAAYNAGPGRVRSWITEFGDPRDSGIDPIDWIEGIPYNETRNYVMRILESLHVYRLRIGGAPAPIRLAAAMQGS